VASGRWSGELGGYKGVYGLGFLVVFVIGLRLVSGRVRGNDVVKVKVKICTEGELEHCHHGKDQQKQGHQLTERQATLARYHFIRHRTACHEDADHTVG